MVTFFPYHSVRVLLLIIGLLVIAGGKLAGQEYAVVVGEIRFEGNKITKERIVLRELMFHSGDTLTVSVLDQLLEKSRENLLNTSLFNFVTYRKNEIGSDPAVADIVFSFTERWYIWPWPIIEFADRNFNTWWNENRDLSRMSYGAVLKWNNFRGRKELLRLTARFGYNEQYGFDYTIPLLNRKETLGMGLGLYYNRTKEVAVANIHDQLVYYKNHDEYVFRGWSSFLSLSYRREIYNTHTLRLEYEFRDYADTLPAINPSFSPNGLSAYQYLSLVYQLKIDHRDYKPYPLNGYYFDLEAGKRGLGLLENGGLDVFYISGTFRKYFQIHGRWYFASGLNSRFSNESEWPFPLQRAIGYGRDIVRGYEYYVVSGNNYGIFKNNLKFALLPPREVSLGFLRSEKFSKLFYAFYMNAFLDMGFADNPYPDHTLENRLENSFLIGYGLGLDFVTYYDLVFRFEYSLNRMGEHGFYLHFMAPI